MFRLVGLTKVYGQGEQSVTALRDFDFTFPERGLVSIVGESGCGKTTLLNILGGMDFHTEGDFFIDGRNSKELTSEEWDEYRNTTVGVVFQDFYVFDELTAAENVSLPLAICTVDSASAEALSKQALEKMRLKEQMQKRVGTLSGGQKQRVALARAIVKGPRALLADEPTGNLDSENSELIFRILSEIAEATLVIVVTHDRKLARRFSDICITLADGRIVKVTRPRENRKQIVLLTDGKEREFVDARELVDYLSDITMEAGEKELTLALRKPQEDVVKSEAVSSEAATRIESNAKTEAREKGDADQKAWKAQALSGKKVRTYANRLLAKRVWRRRVTTGAFLIGIFLFLLTLALLNYNEERAVTAYWKAYRGDAVVQKQVESVMEGDAGTITVGVSARSRSFFEKIAGKDAVFLQMNEATLSDSKQGGVLELPAEEAGETNASEALPVTAEVTVRVLMPQALSKRAAVEIREDSLVVTDYVAEKMGLTENDIGKEYYLCGIPTVLTAILATDYEEARHKLAMDISHGENLISQYYNVVYVPGAFSERLAKEADGKPFYLHGAYFFYHAIFPYLYNGFDVIGSNFLEEEIPLEGETVCLAYGRMPEAENEILVSWSLAEQEGLVSEMDGFHESAFLLKDIHSAEYKENYEDRLNLFEILGASVTVVGVMNCGDIAIAVREDKYKEIMNAYYDLYVYSSLGLLQEECAEHVGALHDAGFRYADSCLEPVYELVDARPTLLPYLIGLLLLLLLLIAFMMFSHIRYGIKDNYRNIGILRAIGVTMRDIRRLFLREPRGMTRISALGGAALCLLTLWVVNLRIESKMGARPYTMLHIHVLPLLCSLVLLYGFGLLLAWLPVKAVERRAIIGVIKE